MRFIRLNEENKVTSLRFGQVIAPGEIESAEGNPGQIMQSDGTFITPEPTPTEPVETAEEKLERLEQQVTQDNLIQFEVLATIYEEIQLLKGGI